MDTNTSRRALIGGTGLAAIIAAVPVLSAASPIAPPAPGSTDARLAAWKKASVAMMLAKLKDVEVCARFNAAEAAGTMTNALTTEWDDSCGVLCDAEWALFDTPAPDLNAVEWKLTMLRDHKFPLDDNTADRLLADVRALGREG